MSNNIITATFPSSMGSQLTYADPIYQYDYGMVLQFVGLSLPMAYEVHFANTDSTGNSITQIGNADGVSVPDELLLTGKTVYAWVYLHSTVDDGETVYKVVIPVNRRAKPTNATPTPVQQDVITEAIAALDAAVEQTAADVQTTSGFVDDARGYASAADGSAQAAAGSAGLALGYAQSASASAQTASEKASEILNLTGDATVDANTGTPSVEVTVSEVDDHKNMSFSFHNLKGERGETGSQGIPGPTGQEGPAGPEGSPGQDGSDGFSPVVTVTAITGGHNVEITDAQGTTDFDVMDGEVSEQDLEDALIDKADAITSSASGEIVTIADGADNLPVKNLSVSLLPVQDFHGYDNPWPAGGGKNMLSAQDGSYAEKTSGNMYFVNGMALEAGTYYVGRYKKESSSESTGIYLKIGSGSASRLGQNEGQMYIARSFTLEEASTVSLYLSSSVTGGYYRFMLSTSVLTNGQNDFAPYSNLCPISGWTGVDVYHSDEDTSNPTTYPISWQSTAGTVYGGTLNLTTGVLTVTDANIASYNGETLPSTWISDRDVYAAGTTPATGAQVVYKLATPTTYQLTPSQISTFLGVNNFWSNGNGVVDLEYRADTKLYIEQLTKPTEDDMVANQNITSGSFFMVGNRLFLSSVAIAQGEQIVVGTNCNEISLADALNQINA